MSPSVRRTGLAATSSTRCHQGGDAYLLKFIVHDWDDDRAVVILRNCRTAMAPAGSGADHRWLKLPETEFDAKHMDVTMLVFKVGASELSRNTESCCAVRVFASFEQHQRHRR